MQMVGCCLLLLQMTIVVVVVVVVVGLGWIEVLFARGSLSAKAKNTF